jgi:hypothetical protein
MPIGFSKHGFISAEVDSSVSQRPVAAISWEKHDGSRGGGFTFDLNDDVPPVSVPASYYEGEDLEGITLPSPGSNDRMRLNSTIGAGSLCNAEFVVKTCGLHTRYLQAMVLPPERTENPLNTSWQGTFRDPDGESERVLAAGFKSGTDAEVKKLGKPDWAVLSQPQPLHSLKRLLSGK